LTYIGLWCILFIMIDLILLGFLSYKPMTGYDIKREMDHSTTHFWHAHHSQIYTTLRRMEKEALLTSQMVMEEGQPNRRVYNITDEGKKKLQDWLDKPLTELDDYKCELLVKVFFSGFREDEDVLNELILQRKLHTQHLSVYQELDKFLESHIKTHADPRMIIYSRFTLQMGLRYERMFIGWLDDTIEEIKNM
jgi:PadR family transcriptional regulator, regulatory protein AphA